MTHRLPVSVLLVHAEPAVRDQLARRLQADESVTSCDHTGSLTGAVTALATQRHDVLVTASALPDGAGADLVEVAAASRRPTATVLLVERDDPTDVAEAIRAGAQAVCTIDEVDAVLLHAARSVPCGARVIQHSCATSLAAMCPQQAHTLSPRELEVLTCLTLGLTNAETARRLYVSHETVKSHVARVLRKLEVSDRRTAAERALLLGLVTPGSDPADEPVVPTPPGTSAAAPDHRPSAAPRRRPHAITPS